MRLLNTSTFRLRQLTEGESAPPYAALSHCWGAEEVLYSDLQSTDKDLSQKYGFQKLVGACREAFDRHQLDWLWADTVCIDRSSSAELSESINSMYRWYRNCNICLAYLGDVCASVGPPEDVLAKSRWMQRSWTLIELIAPRNLQFFSADWSLIGTKESLISNLSRITQIDETVLEDADSMSDFPIGKRMSWAARRSATKVEDVAYSLLGIFGISMSTIYGEGERAFMRLQEELLKTLDDASLFAWKATDDQEYRGILARSPSEFEHFGLQDSAITSWRLPTCLRLAFTAPTLTCGLGLDGFEEETSLPLSDISDNSNTSGSLGIRLCMWQGRLVRSSPQRLFYVSSKVPSGTREIPHLWTAHRQPYYCPTCGTTFARDSTRDQHIRDRTCSPEQCKEAPQGLSEGQLQKLAKRRKPGTSEVNQWFDIWNLIYAKGDVLPPHGAPRTPYLTGKLESAVCIARDFWVQKGKFVIADFLEQRALRDYEVRDEERNLSALYQITLNNVVDQLVQLLADEGSRHIEPSHAMSNVLSTLRKFWSKLM
ncbi:HET-domain-containing protein [Apiospora saccharicola]